MKYFNDFLAKLGEKNRSFRIGLASLVISLILTLCIYIILHADLKNGWEVDFQLADQSTKALLAALFCVASISSFAIMYFTSRQEADDIYTPFRKKLIGIWKVTSTISRFDQLSGKIKEDKILSICNIGINFEKKLEFHFTIDNSDIFDDHKIDVNLVTFDPDRNDGKLIYFYDQEIDIQESIQKDYREQLGLQDGRFRQKIFVSLNYKTLHGRVESLDGKWYDIESSTAALVKKLAHLRNSAVGDQEVLRFGEIKFRRYEHPDRVDI